MKVHIERIINIITFLKEHGYLSNSNYSSKDNATFAFDDKKVKFVCIIEQHDKKIKKT